MHTNINWITICLCFYDTNITTARIKVNESGSTLKDDRGNHKNKNKVTEGDNIVIENHINSYPKIGSHYLRRQINREFISGSLTLSKMYKMYVEFCASGNIEIRIWTNVLSNKFKIGFCS